MIKWFKLGTLAAVLAIAGLLAIGTVAWAQAPSPSPQPPANGPATGPGTAPSTIPGYGMMGRIGGMMGGGRMGGIGGPQNSLISIAAKVLGMKVEDLTAALNNGQTIADVAKQKGVALDKIVTEFMAPRISAMQDAVKAGRLTQAQADQNIATMKQQVTEHLNQKFTPGQPGQTFGPGDCPMLDGAEDWTCPFCGQGTPGTTPNSAPQGRPGRGMMGRGWSQTN